MNKQLNTKRKHAYSFSSFPDVTLEEETVIFDLCETLVFDENSNVIENENWILKKEKDSCKIDAKNKHITKL